MTGGVESLAFLFYFFAIFMGLIILREKQIIGITLIALLMYISIIVLEYAQIIPHIPYFPDGKGYYLDLNITLNNTITVTLAFLSSAFFVSILSQQIRKREEELMRERDRVKDLSEIKEEFISVAAHQIRSPLNSLKWLFRSLLEGDVGKINKKQEHFLEEGRDRTDKLIHVLNDLLDVSKFERGGFAEIKTKVDISNLVYEVLDQYFPNAKEKDIDLQFNYKIRVPEFKVDKEKIKMVIENLVDNAIKYNKDGGVVEIGLKRLNDSIVLSVKDNGIGIPKSEEKKIFSKFFRSKNAKLVEVTGSGLGLYISKEIVDAHQGKIWFKTSENNGTTFFVELPIME
ncbi:MAG: HAMP domain-containing sensor histidine kinase [Patescibacteria group bacterium]|nr:HAMP domain-containing histidine kinase [Patescibacteria group bacterium]